MNTIDSDHQKVAHRKKGNWVAIAGLTSLLIAGTAVCLWQAHEATQAREGETAERLRAGQAHRKIQFLQAESAIEAGKAAQGLGILVQLLREDPSHRPASGRLLSILRSKPFAWPKWLQHWKGTVAAYSSDETLLARAHKNQIQLVNPHDGSLIGDPLVTDGMVSGLAFSRNSKLLAFTSGNTCRLWDLETRTAIGAPMVHQHPVRASTFRPDGRFESATARGLYVWDPATGEPVGAPRKASSSIQAIRFDPSYQTALHGERLIKGKQVNETWNLAKRSRSISQRVEDTPQEPPLVTFLPGDSKREQGKRIRTGNYFPHSSRVASPMGHYHLVVGNGNGRAYSWEVASPVRPQRVDGVRQQSSRASRHFLSPDRQRLFVVGREPARCFFWDLMRAEVVSPTLAIDGNYVFHRFSKDSQRLVVVSKNESHSIISAWDTQTGKPVYPARLIDRAAYIKISEDAAYVVEKLPGRIDAWNAVSGTKVGTGLTYSGQLPEFSGITFEGNLVAVPIDTPDTDLIKIWDLATNHQQDLDVGDGYLMGGGVLIGPNKDTIITISARTVSPGLGSADGRYFGQLWHWKDAKRIGQQIEANMSRSEPVWTPDGAQFITGSPLRLWDRVTGIPKDPVYPRALSAAPGHLNDSGDRLLTFDTSTAGTVQLWDTNSLRPVGEPLSHEGEVSLAKFDSHGKRLVTISEGTVRIWDSTTSKAIGPPIRLNEEVKSYDLSDDGSMILISSGTEVRGYDTESGLPFTGFLNHPEAQSPIHAFFGARGDVYTSVSLTPQNPNSGLWRWPQRGICPTPVPSWFLNWAEAMGGLRLSKQDVTEIVPWHERRKALDSVPDSETADFFTTFARSYVKDSGERSSSGGGLLVARESRWQYLSKGEPPSNWADPDYDSSSWASGEAKLGFGDGDEQSLIKPDPRNRITFYFRRSFFVLPSALETEDPLQALIRCDDGAVVYFNGTEVFRTNMPLGPVGAQTPAIRSISGPEERRFISSLLPKNVLHSGRNVIAVEVHQSSPRSSDLGFDLALGLGVQATQPEQLPSER